MMRKKGVRGKLIEGFPDKIGTYVFDRVLGRGSFSTVVMAKQEHTGRIVAIKVLSRHLLVEQDLVNNFMREITIFSKLSHPNILRFYEILSDNDMIYVVMEYCAHKTLQDLIGEYGGLGESAAKTYVAQLASAIHYMHDNGVAHRDIKLENILLDDKDCLKLSDFGFSRESLSGDLCTTTVGSPIYACPEIISLQQYDPKQADMWSLGVVIYILVMGEVPWKETSNLTSLFYQIQTSRYHIPQEMSSLFRSLIHSLMHPLPEMRLTASQVISHPWLSIGACDSAVCLSRFRLKSRSRSIKALAVPFRMRMHLRAPEPQKGNW
jgi:serine/threonine protein kinase